MFKTIANPDGTISIVPRQNNNVPFTSEKILINLILSWYTSVPLDLFKVYFPNVKQVS